MFASFIDPARLEQLRRFVRSGGLRELILFLIIGGTGAIAYTALNYMFTKSGIRPSLSIALTLVLLIPPVYVLQHRLTFRSGRNHLSAFPRYVGAQLFGNIIAMAVAEAVPEPIKANPLPAFILISMIVAAINYGILKFWAFSHSPPATN
jgi:putative flippase GtrA